MKEAVIIPCSSEWLTLEGDFMSFVGFLLLFNWLKNTFIRAYKWISVHHVVFSMIRVLQDI